MVRLNLIHLLNWLSLTCLWAIYNKFTLFKNDLLKQMKQSIQYWVQHLNFVPFPILQYETLLVFAFFSKTFENIHLAVWFCRQELPVNYRYMTIMVKVISDSYLLQILQYCTVLSQCSRLIFFSQFCLKQSKVRKIETKLALPNWPVARILFI